MRVLIRSYDLDDDHGSGAALSAIARALEAEHDTVWATSAAQTLDEVRAWHPDLIVAQQWATAEANAWAVTLRAPFVMLVHGPRQFEQFMPLCDLVAFSGDRERASAAAAVGRTPTTILPSSALDDRRRFRAELLSLVSAGRRRPTLTLCMTVANEAQTLDKAIDSVAGVVDAIVIGVDQRSQDGTAAIARRRATTYFEYEESSPPDFRRMRNRTLDLVDTDWAIVVDGHEWIEGAALIPAALATAAWSIEIQTLFEPDENRVPGLAFPFPRIHRRHVRCVGTGAHEEVSTPHDRRDARMDIHVWHERKPGVAAEERAREKSGGELDVLRDAWTTRGDRRALFYLANGLKDAGRHDDAIAAYEKYLEAPNFEDEGWQAQLYLARCRAARREWAAARDSFGQAILAAPQRAEAIVGLAYVLLAEGRARTASAWFRMAASLPQPTDCRMFVEVPVYRWGAWHGLALALDRLGDYRGAADAEIRARAGGAGAWATDNINLWRERASYEQSTS